MFPMRLATCPVRSDLVEMARYERQIMVAKSVMDLSDKVGMRKMMSKVPARYFPALLILVTIWFQAFYEYEYTPHTLTLTAYCIISVRPSGLISYSSKKELVGYRAHQSSSPSFGNSLSA